MKKRIIIILFLILIPLISADIISINSGGSPEIIINSDSYIEGFFNCAPTNCVKLGYNCGTWDDNCAGTLNCGTCGSGSTCSSGICTVAPIPPSGGEGNGGGGSTTKYECSRNSDCNNKQYCLNHVCYDAECIDDSSCNVKEGETCFNYKCVKLFDVEIIDFESPIKLGDFFDFTYRIRGMANISGDVEINFFIEKGDKIVTSGKDTLYLGNFEEKIKKTKLFLPSDVDSGTYLFRIEVTFGNYVAKSHRTVEIAVKEGVVTIKLKPEISSFLIYALLGLIILILFIILLVCLRRKRKKQFNKLKKKKHKS